MSFQMYVHTVDTKGKLQSSVSPSSANDLANKDYVDTAIAAGGGDWEASVIKQESSPPGTASSGDRYLVIATASGAWSGKEKDIAEYDGSSWAFTTPTKGTHVYDEDSGNALIYNGSAWVVLANATGALIKTNNLSDVSSASTARSNLGLGSLAEKNSVNLTGSDVSGTLGVSAGGTGATSKTDAQVNLDLVPGTDIMAYDADLAAIAGLSSADGNVIVGSASGWVAESGATARASLGLGTGDSPQFTALNIGAASDTTLARASAGELSIEGKQIYREDGTDVAVADGGTGASNATQARSNLGLTIGSNVQAYALGLSQIANLSPSSDDMLLYSSGAWESKGKDDIKTALSLGTAADATIATGLSSTGGNLIKVKSGTNLSNGDLLAVDSNGDIVAGSGGGGGSVTSITPGADSGSGTAITTSGTIKIEGDGGAISTSVSGTDVTISAGDASTSAKGVAKFSSTNFAVSSGEVTIKAAGIDLESEVTGKLPVSEGGTGADTAILARSNLGLTIGTNVQAYSLNLNAIASVSPSNGDTLLYSSGVWDKTTYGHFTAPIKRDLSYSDVSSQQTIAPTSIDAAYEEYVLDLADVSGASTFTLPKPAAGDVGKSITIKVMGGMASSRKLTVSVDGGSDKMDGLSSVELDQSYQRLTFTAIQAAADTGIDVYSLG